jgi:hypothetical protein
LFLIISISAFPILVNMLETQYDDHMEIIHCTLNCILRVFRLQTRAPKSGFCHLFAKEGILSKLAISLSNITSRNLDTDQQKYFSKLSDIFLLFSQVDSKAVKEELCNPDVLQSKKYIYFFYYINLCKLKESYRNKEMY